MTPAKPSRRTPSIKITYMPIKHVIPIYPPGYVHPGEAFRAKHERDRKEMLEKRAARQRRQAIIDDLKIIR